MTKQEAQPESNPNTRRFIKVIQNFFCSCCNENGMKDASLLESLIACFLGESEPQKSKKSGLNPNDLDLKDSKNIFAPNKIWDEEPSVEFKTLSAESLSDGRQKLSL